MKLPTSSSVLLATLAISSSSSSLAAPAGDMHDSGLSQSPNKYTHHDSNMHPAHEHNSRPMHMKRRSESIVARINGELSLFLPVGHLLSLHSPKTTTTCSANLETCSDCPCSRTLRSTTMTKPNPYNPLDWLLNLCLLPRWPK